MPWFGVWFVVILPSLARATPNSIPDAAEPYGRMIRGNDGWSTDWVNIQWFKGLLGFSHCCVGHHQWFSDIPSVGTLDGWKCAISNRTRTCGNVRLRNASASGFCSAWVDGVSARFSHAHVERMPRQMDYHAWIALHSERSSAGTKLPKGCTKITLFFNPLP